tara:strand:+ start:960 stop:5027 length:4068 start_codon:yes stop_codon:yes gene_type:complete
MTDYTVPNFTFQSTEEKPETPQTFRYSVPTLDIPTTKTKEPKQAFQSVYDFENDPDVLKDWDVVANALNAKGEEISEFLRDTDFSLGAAMKRAYDTNNLKQNEIDSFNRLKTKFDNTELSGVNEYFELIKDAGIDTISDPFTIVALAAAPFTGGTSLAAKQAATKIILDGAKRYSFSQLGKAATRPAIFTAGEGATWAGLHNYYNQDIDLDLGNRQGIDWNEVKNNTLLGGGIGGVFGLGAGLYSGTKYFNRAFRYHNEDKIIKQTDGLSRKELLESDELLNTIKDNPYQGLDASKQWIDAVVSKLPFFGKATTQFQTLSKSSETLKDFLLALRYDATRTTLGKNKATDSMSLSYFEELDNYMGQYKGIGIDRVFNNLGFKGFGRKITAQDNAGLLHLMQTGGKAKTFNYRNKTYTISEDVKKAYFGDKDKGIKGVQDLLDDAFDEGSKLGIFEKFGKVKNYFPRLFKHGSLEQNVSREAFKDLLIKYGYANPDNRINEKKYLTKYINAAGKEEMGIPANTLGKDEDIFGKGTDFIAEAKKRLPSSPTDNDVLKRAQELKANRIIDNMLDLKYSQYRVGGVPNIGAGKPFLQHRIFNNIPDTELTAIDVINNDVMEVLNDYMLNVSQLFARKKSFGVKTIGEFQNKWLNPIDEELTSLGAARGEIDSSLQGIENLFREVTGLSEVYGEGLGERGIGKKLRRGSESVRLIEQMAHLGFATLSSITEPNIIFSRVGMPNYPEATKNILVGLTKEVTKNFDQLTKIGTSYIPESTPIIGKLGGKKSFKDIDDEYWKELYQGNLAIEDSALNGVDRLASGDRLRTRFLRNTQNTFFKMNLLTQWTRAVQGAAFTSGKMLIRENARKLYDDAVGVKKLSTGSFRNLGMNQKEYLERQLLELGIQPKDAMNWYRSSLNDIFLFDQSKATKSPYYKNVLQGAKRFTTEVILNPSKAQANRSLWLSNGTGKILFQFAGYPTVFNNTVIKRMVNEIANYPIQTGPKNLITALLMTTIALQANQLRNPDRFEKLSDEEKIVEAVERYGGLAQGSIVKRMYDAKEYGAGPLEMIPRGIFGPVAGDVLDTIDYNFGPTTFVYRNLPFSQLPTVFMTDEQKKTLRKTLREFDESLFNNEEEDTRKGRPKKLKLTTGGLVEGPKVPNTIEDPADRINPETGQTYSGKDVLDLEMERLGFSRGGNPFEEIIKASTRAGNVSTIVDHARNNLGLRDEAIAGVLGNIDVETGGTFDYLQKQIGGPGRGLFQLDPSGPLPKLYEEFKLEKNLKDSPIAQLDFFHETIFGDKKYREVIGYGNARKLKKIMTEGTPAEISVEIMKRWERPSKPHTQRRIESTNNIFKLIKDASTI